MLSEITQLHLDCYIDAVNNKKPTADFHLQAFNNGLREDGFDVYHWWATFYKAQEIY